MQRTDAWFKQRRGKLTASNLGAALGVSPYTSRRRLWRIMREPPSPERFHNVACDWGTANEPNGIMEYVAQTGNEVTPEGFVPHPSLDWMGGSPDGLVGEDGMIEVKCPYKKQQYGKIPYYYYPQINCLLECTGREWCDFVVWTHEDCSITRIRRNTDHFEALLPYYINLYGLFCSGTEPNRMRPCEKAAMIERLERYIEESTIPVKRARPSDLQLYLSDEIHNVKKLCVAY